MKSRLSIYFQLHKLTDTSCDKLKDLNSELYVSLVLYYLLLVDTKTVITHMRHKGYGFFFYLQEYTQKAA